MPSTKWTKEQVKEVLEDRRFQNASWTVKDEKSLQDGVQFVLRSGTRVNWYLTGTVNVQGTPGNITDEAKSIFAASYTSYQTVPRPKIFVVYGHNRESRDSIEKMIKGFGLIPIILDQIPGMSNTILEQLEEQIEDAAFACVLLTPDDEGYRKCKPAGKEISSA